MINGRNYITIASDASCGQERTGFAYYIRDDDGTHQLAWFVEEVMTSTEAEITAMRAALKAMRQLNIKENTTVIYYCDNSTVLQVMDNSFTKRKRKYSEVVAEAAELLEGMTIETRHVKGHTRGGELKRFYLNRWCDHNARAMMRHGRYHQTREYKKGAKR